MISHALTKSGVVVVKFWNTGVLTRSISHKVGIVDVLSVVEPEFYFEFSDECDFVSVEVRNESDPCGVETWIMDFPRLADSTIPFASTPLSREIKVCHREIEWKCPFDDIPLSWRGQMYDPECVPSQEAHQYLQSLIERGVVRKLGRNERCLISPALFLRKRHGGVRKVMDYRYLNAYSLENHVGLRGGMTKIMSQIHASWKYFTVIDLESGFSNLPVCEKLQQLFGFEFGGERFTYVTLPQGWKNSSSIFHSRISQIFSKLGCVCYVDDILVGARTIQEHDCRIKKVFQVLTDFGFRVNFSKMRVAQEHVLFLGYDVCSGSYSLQSYIRAQMSNLPSASSTTQIRKILGIFNFCRGFVPRLDILVKPVIAELKKAPHKRCSLSVLQQMCADVWKTILKTSVDLALSLGNKEEEWNLMVDWCREGMGYALFLGDPGEDRLLGMGSKSDKTVLSSHLGELAALKWALSQLRSLLSGKPVTLWTDSASVVAVLEREDLEAAAKDVREARIIGWLLANFPVGVRLFVKHVSGDFNVVADRLSRWHVKHGEVSQVQPAMQLSDERRDIIGRVHSDGHYNARTTLLHLRRDGYNWPGIYKHVLSVVRRCLVCQCHGARGYSDGLSGHLSTDFNQLVYCDFAGPYPMLHSTERRSILVLVDSFSRLVRTYVVRKVGAECVHQSLEKWKEDFGAPIAVQSDNARAFCGSVLRVWCDKNGVEQRFSSAYDPHSNGIVERMIGNLKIRIKKIIGLRALSWTGSVKQAEDIINRSVNSVTRYTPNELAFGKRRDGSVVDEATLSQWKQNAIRNTLSEQRRADRRFRKWRVTRPVLRVGDLVLWKIPKQEMDSKNIFQAAWRGPYRIVSRRSRMFWTIQELNSGIVKRHIHSHALKGYFD